MQGIFQSLGFIRIDSIAGDIEEISEGSMEFGLVENTKKAKTAKSRNKKRRRKEKMKISEESKSLVHIRRDKNAEEKRRKEKREIIEESKPLLYIPQEIIDNILCRLPLKPLCRFKIVCQTWNSSILNTPY